MVHSLCSSRNPYVLPCSSSLPLLSLAQLVLSTASLSPPSSSTKQQEMPAPPHSPTGADRLLGTLVVIVLRAKNLPNRVRIGKQNPYATVTYGLHKKRTSTIERGGQQPEWDAEFRFEILKDGLGGEEQLAAEASTLVNASGGIGPLPPTKEGVTASASGTSLVAASPITGHPSGKKVLRIACWADDARDPKLIGEGELDIEGTIKAGTSDRALTFPLFSKKQR